MALHHLVIVLPEEKCSPPRNAYKTTMSYCSTGINSYNLKIDDLIAKNLNQPPAPPL